MSEEFKSAPLDLASGLAEYNGEFLTIPELIKKWEQETYAHQDEVALLRDYTQDAQNLWGDKDGGRNGTQFRDRWYFRLKGNRRRSGYPRDLGY